METGTSLREVWTAKLVVAVVLVAAGSIVLALGEAVTGSNLISMAVGLVGGGGLTTALVKSDARRNGNDDGPGHLIS